MMYFYSEDGEESDQNKDDNNEEEKKDEQQSDDGSSSDQQSGDEQQSGEGSDKAKANSTGGVLAYNKDPGQSASDKSGSVDDLSGKKNGQKDSQNSDETDDEKDGQKDDNKDSLDDKYRRAKNAKDKAEDLEKKHGNKEKPEGNQNPSGQGQNTLNENDLRNDLTNKSENLGKNGTGNNGSGGNGGSGSNGSSPSGSANPSGTSGEIGKEGVKEGAKEATKEGAKQATEQGTKEAAKQVGTNATTQGASTVGTAAEAGTTVTTTTGGTVATTTTATGATTAATTAGGAATTAATAATPVGWVILAIILIIILIIIITGLVFFFIAMPGQVTAKFKNLATGVINSFQSIVAGGETIIPEQEIADVANYLENMGYDLKGEGFISNDESVNKKIKRNKDNLDDLSTEELQKETEKVLKKKIKDIKDDNDNIIIRKEEQYVDSKTGVIREGNNKKITYIKSEPIWTYIVSDNLCYMIKNFNQNLNAATNGHGGVVITIAGIAIGLGLLFYSPVAVFVAAGLTFFAFASNPNWGSGLISIRHERDNILGAPGSSYKEIELGYIKLDSDSKKMTIKRGWTNNAFTYDVDGWGGQYGMPLEFLLSVHIATQMPDLAMEMATSFNTDVEVLLRSIKGNVQAGYVTENGNIIPFSEVIKVATADNNKLENTWNAVAKWLENHIRAVDADGVRITSLTDSAMEKLFKMGFPHSSNCDCEWNEDGSLKFAGDNCVANIKKIFNALEIVNKQNTDSYTPYISKVKDHWFRDVYFVKENASKTNVTQVDEDYFYQTEERWTIYETYTKEDKEAGKIPDGFDVDDYKLYEYKDGNYILSTRTKAEVDKLNQELAEGSTTAIRLIKKPASTTLKGNSNDVWSAYDITDYNEFGEWETVEIDENSPDALKGFEGKLKYRQKRPSDIIQVEDGQRAETNSKIKDMFVNKLYYKYDGSSARADLINIDKAITDRAFDNTKEGDRVINSKGKEVLSPGDQRNSSLLGKVSIAKDSLGAFSMLENTHTLDADYVYRDFKELIVELNYFDKEDLSQKVSEVMQWPLPEAGSSGWPLRGYEKGENFYGTLINSKVDLKLMQQEEERRFNEVEENELVDGEGYTDIEDDSFAQVSNLEIAYNKDSNETDISRLDIMEDSSIKTMLAQIDKQYDNKSNVSFRTEKTDSIAGKVKKLLASVGSSGECEYIRGKNINTKPGKGEHSFDITWNGVDYEVWRQIGPTCTLYAGAFLLQAYTDQTFEQCIVDSRGSKIVDRGKGTNKYWNPVALFDKIAEDIDAKIYRKNFNLEMISNALNNGIPVWVWSSYGASTYRHAIVLLGNYNQSLYMYDPASGNIKAYTGASGYEQGLQHLWSHHISRGAVIIIPNNAPTGSKKLQSLQETFQGYEPEQVVVSPLTGKVTEYGTVIRTNVETGKDEEVEFIKIEAINKNIYKEDGDGYSKCKKINKNEYSSFEESNKKNSNALKKEGYDYFYEEYQGVCDGFVLYIEGFDLTLFDSDGAKKLVESGDTSSEKVTRYQPNTVYNMTDDLKEARAYWREDAKTTAIPVMTIGDDVYIKEGTVIGKTSKDPEESLDTCNGNYIRLIFRNLEDSIVENVEDYFPISESNGAAISVANTDWEFYYWLPYESGALEGSGRGPEACGTVSSSSEVAVGIAQWTSIPDKCNNIAEICRWLVTKESSFCSELSAFKSYSSKQIVQNYSDLKNAWTTVASKDREKFLALQMEYFYENEFKGWLNKDHTNWLLNKSMVAQGTYASLKNWAPNSGWKNVINEKMSDEEIVKALLKKACGIGSTMGTLEDRWNSQYTLAKDILHGVFSDVEGWVKTKKPVKYGEGKNNGAL